MKGRWLHVLCPIVVYTVMAGCVSPISHFQESQPAKPASIPLTGERLTDAVLTATDDHGHPLTLKIASVELDPNDRDLYLYTVLHQPAPDSQWQNLCQPDRNGISKAIALSGQWDQNGNHLDNGQITFACTNSVLAKCTQMGYKPWRTVNGQSLRDYHQACTRMLRADYCGNGIAHTQEGTPVDVYDRLRIQQPTANSRMGFEAAWNSEGAVWLSRTRYLNTLKQLQQECPKKLQVMLRGRSHIDDFPTEIESNALIFNRS